MGKGVKRKMEGGTEWECGKVSGKQEWSEKGGRKWGGLEGGGNEERKRNEERKWN